MSSTEPIVISDGENDGEAIVISDGEFEDETIVISDSSEDNGEVSARGPSVEGMKSFLRKKYSHASADDVSEIERIINAVSYTDWMLPTKRIV